MSQLMHSHESPHSNLNSETMTPHQPTSKRFLHTKSYKWHLQALVNYRSSEATKNDSTLQILAQVVHEGWPKTIQDCPCSIQSYWYFRDEITYKDEILYKGT